MHCPYCRNTDTRVLDSRVADDGGSIRRRRTCSECERRFTTVELMQLTVLKRSGATEPFTREKAISGVRKACKGRPVTEDQLACLGQEVEDSLRLAGAAEIPAHEVGLAILGPAPRARRGRLPPLRERLPRLRVGRRTSRKRSPACAPTGRPTLQRSSWTPTQPPAADHRTARQVVGKRPVGRTNWGWRESTGTVGASSNTGLQV